MEQLNKMEFIQFSKEHTGINVEKFNTVIQNCKLFYDLEANCYIYIYSTWEPLTITEFLEKHTEIFEYTPSRYQVSQLTPRTFIVHLEY